MSPIDFPKIYNPANQTKEELINSFVVRTKLFQDIFNAIKNAEMKHPEQHYIIQGIRGQGKTTMLLRIAYEIEKHKSLRKKMIPIIFNEEQYNITRLFKLWETIARYLEDLNESDGLYNKMQEYEHDEDFEIHCFEILENEIKNLDKKLILFIDNIDEMFEKFSKKEHHRLREVLIQSAELRIIGASSVTLEFHYDYGKPFYQFFKMPRLKGLNSDETKTFLLKLGEHYKRERVKNIVEKQPGRVEALRRLTGGVIRTIVILFEIFVDDTDGSAFQDLEKILDNVTPLYKHRMDKLATQQQEIVDFIALNWDAVSTGEIAKKTKLKSKAVSSQLKKLEKFHIIEKERTTTKNYLYRIHERFFNIWYLMRHGRKWDERRVRFLVEFLQIWCDNKELEARAKKHLKSIAKGTQTDKYALFMTEALIRTPLKREMQHQLVTTARQHLDKSHSELITYLSKSDLEYKENAIEALKKREFQKAANYLESIKVKDADDLTILGTLYAANQKNLRQAKNMLLKAAEEGHPGAMNGLAWWYFERKINKQESLVLAENLFLKEKNIYSSHTYCMILLWHDKIQEAVKIAGEFLEDEQSYRDFPDDMNLFFLFLLAKKQYHLTLKIFEENPHHLKDRFKPVYYAMMYFLQKEYPNEYRKMGSELKQTVEEIIEKIRQLEKDYG